MTMVEPSIAQATQAPQFVVAMKKAGTKMGCLNGCSMDSNGMVEWIRKLMDFE